MKSYLIYLRKSRKDRDQELATGQFDTLQRHRGALLSLAKARGYSIAHIYEEVVSGDSIAERPEMQKLLAAVETGAFEGVLVMEVPRLARGNTRDQGVVSETFQYSGTKIITPDKIYDPADEADEEYFEFGLFMSRREYKAINRRLQRGRMASLEEGKYIAGTAPYGYRRVRVPHQRGYTLEPSETAPVVQEIFRLYTEGDPQSNGSRQPIGSYGIANLLNARGIPSPGGVKWTAAAVRDVLKNPTYAGYIRWSYRPDKKQMVNGVLTVSHPVNKEAELKKGLHPPLITEETWTAANAAMHSRAHTPLPGRKQIANPLAGLVYCSVCGRSLVQLPQGSHGEPMVMCPTARCPTVGSRRDAVEAALMEALESWLKHYEIRLKEEEQGASGAELEAGLQKARKQLDNLAKQRGSLYDLLEQGVYSKELFLERSRLLAERTTETERQVSALEGHLASLRQAELLRKSIAPRIRNVLDVYGTLETPAEQNALLKSVLDHVVYTKTARGKKSDLQLFVYPKIPTKDDFSLKELPASLC